mgnify:FL=1
MNALERFSELVTGHSRLVIVGMLVLTVVVASGASAIPAAPPQDASEFIDDSDELAAIEYVQDVYSSDEGVSTIQLFARDHESGSALSKAALLDGLYFQQTLYADETVTAPLVTDRPAIVGVENVVATAAMGRSEPTLHAQVAGVTLEDQIAQLESMTETEVATVVATVLSGATNAPAGGQALRLLPVDYEAGEASAEARALLVSRDVSGVELGEDFPPAVADSELAISDLAADQSHAEYFMVTFTTLLDEDAIAMSDSLTLVIPLALGLIVVALVVAYRKLADIALALLGTVVVLLWLFGLMGWLGIPGYDIITLGVPVLLIGISVDYAIHTFMRHREERSRGEASRLAMRRSLVGVGAALLWVTLTAGLGFLSNLTSDLAEIRSFGVATTLGLVAALLVFTTLVPALKIEIDGLLARFGRDRTKSAFGAGGGRFSRVLATGAAAARRAPAFVLAIALVVSAGAAYGATQLEASADQEFLADDPPGWMSSLPEPFKPGDYTAKEKLTYVETNFRGSDATAGYVLLRGAIDDDRALERMAVADGGADPDAFIPSADGSRLVSPLSAMQRVAAIDPDFAATFEAADTDGDGVPDREVAVLYDALYTAAPELAASVLERSEEGAYVSALVIADPVPTASDDAVTAALRALAADLETGDGTITAVPTGDAVILSMTLGSLIENVIMTLLVTLVAVIVLLMVGYRVTEGSASLGFVTLLPVAFGVAWFFGTLWVLGEELTLLTSVIASMTVGLGVDYSIHLGERYKQELASQSGVWPALYATMHGTGGALFGGFVTTVAAFATLGLSTMPQLQQFGVLVALALVYAFVSTLLVLPSLLVIWTRFFGPTDADFEQAPRVRVEPALAGEDD